LIQKNR